ncbi:MAG: NgoFVII family restriction endonuclease [Chitinispirillia bacterium]|nr:NgoFVII family restriction endonuclease [Chitinispirillia bacterium]
MIYSKLYYEVLVKPCQEGADTLKIISGFATSAMASEHLEDLYGNGLNVNISLLVGMCPLAGLSLSNHNGFQSIMTSAAGAFKDSFSCSYIYKEPPIHSKLYAWYKNKQLYRTFIGSANYTRHAFSKRQGELMAEITDTDISDYLQSIEKNSIFCNHHEAETLITIMNDANYYRQHIHEDPHPGRDAGNVAVEHVSVPLYSLKTGEVQNHAGLNWGHRENYKRDLNQAYIQLPPDVYNSDFFPPSPQWFNVVTDDNKSFLCRRAEKSKDGQTIHTPQNNSYLGEYFRNRLGLENGAVVRREHLKRYGREDVIFYKIGDEYYMDFHV